jgi:N,N'-diacetyllegionaminate synthase
MRILGKELIAGAPALVIAEAGVNHNGDMGMAKKMVEEAAEAGADAIKFQTLDASRYISRFAPQADYQQKNTGTEESQVEMVRKYELSRDAHIDLMAHCQKCGIPFFSTAFDEGSVDLLAELGVDCYKIPSGEINNLPLLAHVASKKYPVILSTGMSYLGEVETAVQCLREYGDGEIAIMHCVSNYPTRPADLNLRAMVTMASAFGLPVGLSDHTLGTEASIAAVALGALTIEKHFTLDRSLPGPDHQASLEPGELRAMIQAIRNIEAGMGDGIKRPMPSEQNTREVARKSLVASVPITAGTRLDKDHLDRKRPGIGISPDQMEFVLGRRVVRDIAEDEILTWELLD